MNENKKNQGSPLMTAQSSRMITILLEKEESQIREKGVIKTNTDPDGEVQYTRNDLAGLNSLLSKFDSRTHQLRDMQMFIKVKDKLRKSYLEETDAIILNIEEAKFLKEYLKNFKDRDGRTGPIAEFEIRTMFGVLEQLEGI